MKTITKTSKKVYPVSAHIEVPHLRDTGVKSFLFNRAITSIIALFLIANCLLPTANCFAQAGINYQAVARDSTGAPIINQAISIRASIISGSVGGPVEWEETHAVTTNQFGLFDLAIGQGIKTGGAKASFTDITWWTVDHFLKIEMDPAGAAAYINMGTDPIHTVPYAIFANKADTAFYAISSAPDADADPTNELQVLSISNDTIYLSNGGFAKVPGGADNDWTIDADTLYSAADSTVTIKAGNVGIGTTTPDGKFNISAGGDTAALVVTSTGNVGIGTTSPLTKFQVENTNIGSEQIMMGLRNSSQNAGTGASLVFYGGDVIPNAEIVGGRLASASFADGQLKFKTRKSGVSIDRMIIDEEGNVGIGMTTPLTKLHVNGSVLVENAFSYALRDSAGNGGNALKAGSDDYTWLVTIRSGFGTKIMNYLENSALMTIQDSGNVGIGTVAPSAKLHVYDASAGHIIADALATGNSQFRLYKDGALKWAMYSPNSSNDLRFFDTADRVTLQLGGNVGIGTTTPGQKLEINGGVKLNTATVQPPCDATTRGTIWFVRETGVKDRCEVCALDGAGAYGWRVIY